MTIQLGEVTLFSKNILTACAIIQQTMMRAVSWCDFLTKNFLY
jgi:hypothetical protein